MTQHPTVQPTVQPTGRSTGRPGSVGKVVVNRTMSLDGKDVEVIGTDVATQCLRHGLVDEIFVLVLPVLLGGGTPLFAPGGLDRVNLEPVSSDRIGSATSMRFRVASCAG